MISEIPDIVRDHLVSTLNSHPTGVGNDRIDDAPVNLSSLSLSLSHRDKLQHFIEALESADFLEQKLASPSVEDLAYVSSSLSDLPPEAQQLLRGRINTHAQHMKHELVEKLEGLVSKTGWLSPKYDVGKADAQSLQDLTHTAEQLIRLQAAVDRPVYPHTWWALEGLLQPVVDRFQYHFCTKRDTNRLSKPEWAFSFVETFLAERLALVGLVVGTAFRELRLIADYEIITAMLVPVRAKVAASLEAINAHIEEDPGEKWGRILSHLIFELCAFDQRIKSTYLYNPHIVDLRTPTRNWNGTAADMVHEESTMRHWLGFERQLALKRFQSEILQARDAFLVDVDHAGNPKPTYSSLNLVKLVNNLTTHFQTLGVVRYQLKYVSTILLHVVDAYCDHLDTLYKRKFDVFNSSRVLQAIPGSMAEPRPKVDVLHTFEEIYCSARFVCDALEQWSLELVFVQLWRFFSSQRKDTQDSSIFDASIRQYSAVIDKCIASVESHFKSEIKALLKDYVNSTQWNVSGSEPVVASPLLAPLVRALPPLLDSVKKVMSSGDYLLLFDKVTTVYARIMLEYVVTNNKFNDRGVSQLRADVSYVQKQLGFDNADHGKLVCCVDVLEGVTVEEAKRWREGVGRWGELSEDVVRDLMARRV